MMSETTLFISPPSQLTFEFSRPATGETGTVVGTLVSSSPPRYQYLWPMRQVKGRWQIKASGYKSNTVTFKVDKRKQIVEVANSWVGYEISSTTNCNATIDYIYSYVGLPLGSGGSATALWMASDDNPAKDSMPGSIIFYRSPSQTSATWTDAKTTANGQIASHSALRIDNGIVDTNCGTPGYAPPYNIHYHTNINDPLIANPGRTPENPALDIRDRTPQQLADLDEE